MTIKRYSNIKYEKWDDLKEAVNELIKKGVYQRFVDIHLLMDESRRHAKHRMHSMAGNVGTNRFLPWHRAYLIMLEREIRKVNPELSIPYWDWENDKGRLINFKFFLGLSSGRDYRNKRWFAGEGTFSNFAADTDSYFNFSDKLERGPHNAGHNWVGGDMATMSSPKDPAFWLHHAQADRIWAAWQENDANKSKLADLTGDDAKLDPWENDFNIKNINDISELDSDSYIYV